MSSCMAMLGPINMRLGARGGGGGGGVNGAGHGQLRNGPLWFLKLLFSGLVCNRNAWDCIWPEHGIACWMFCVIFKKTRVSGLSPDYFRGQAWPDLWPRMTNLCYCHQFNGILKM